MAVETLSIEQARALTDCLRSALSEAGSADPERAAQQAVPMIARARAAWPELRVDLEGFCHHVARAVCHGAPAVPEEIVVDDLYLAYACGTGDGEALKAFAREYDAEISTAIGRMRLPAERLSDVRQLLWRRLFVGGDMPPRILEYSGRGRLRSWFRVAVVRMVVDERRRDRRASEPLLDDDVLGVPSPSDDPEVQYLKRLYRHEFQAAFQSAVLGLAAEERNALRSYYAHHMTIDEIAAAYGIHRSTAARRVTKAREALVVATRERLAERLALSTAALESVMRLIESNLHVSVQRLLA